MLLNMHTYQLEHFDLDDRWDNLYSIDSILYPNGFIYDMSPYFLDAHKVRSEQNVPFATMQESSLGMFEIIENNREEGKIRIQISLMSSFSMKNS